MSVWFVLLLLAINTVRSVDLSLKCCVDKCISNNCKVCTMDDKEQRRFNISHASGKTIINCTTYFEDGKTSNFNDSGATFIIDTYMDSNATTTINVRTTNATAKCDNILTPLKFWGATIVVFANIFYLVPYLVVVIFYLAFSELRHRIYDKAVFCFNACQLVIVVILSSMGYFVLCHKPMNSASYIISGLLLMFMTISSVFWLFLICFEMTLVITRFRWIPPDNTKNEEEKRKYLLYSALIWGGALVPTAIAGFFELAPFIPQNSPLKPNFERFNDGANISVIVYVITFPIITCIMNNVLFAYATYKVITIQKSTEIANENRTKNAKKRYFIFLRLYLVMDAPWVVGILAAVFTDLWVLKFCRMVQPIFMLLAMLPKKRLLYATGRIRQSLRITKTNTTNTNQDNKI